MDVLHTAIWVDDLETELAFYTEALGLEQSREFTGDDGVLNTYVKGSGPAEIQFKSSPDEEKSVEPVGIEHIAVATDDVLGLIDQTVNDWGSEVIDGPKVLDDKGIRIAFVTDPEGYVVELIEEL